MMTPTRRTTKGKAPATKRPNTREARRSRMWLIGGVVTSAVILGAWFPASALYHQRSSLAAATSQLDQLHQQDAALAQERKNLSASAEIARIAREQYQLVLPGQQAFQVLPPSGTAAPSSTYAGDPGSTAPVAPSAASELPPGTVPTSSPGTAHSKSTVHVPAHPEGALTRMLHALEFWR